MASSASGSSQYPLLPLAHGDTPKYAIALKLPPDLVESIKKNPGQEFSLLMEGVSDGNALNAGSTVIFRSGNKRFGMTAYPERPELIDVYEKKQRQFTRVASVHQKLMPSSLTVANSKVSSKVKSFVENVGKERQQHMIQTDDGTSEMLQRNGSSSTAPKRKREARSSIQQASNAVAAISSVGESSNLKGRKRARPESSAAAPKPPPPLRQRLLKLLLETPDGTTLFMCGKQLGMRAPTVELTELVHDVGVMNDQTNKFTLKESFRSAAEDAVRAIKQAEQEEEEELRRKREERKRQREQQKAEDTVSKQKPEEKTQTTLEKPDKVNKEEEPPKSKATKQRRRRESPAAAVGAVSSSRGTAHRQSPARPHLGDMQHTHRSPSHTPIPFVEKAIDASATLDPASTQDSGRNALGSSVDEAVFADIDDKSWFLDIPLSEAPLEFKEHPPIADTEDFQKVGDAHTRKVTLFKRLDEKLLANSSTFDKLGQEIRSCSDRSQRSRLKEHVARLYSSRADGVAQMKQQYATLHAEIKDMRVKLKAFYNAHASQDSH